MHPTISSRSLRQLQEREEHHTPFGTVQKFIYCLCRKEPRCAKRCQAMR